MLFNNLKFKQDFLKNYFNSNFIRNNEFSIIIILYFYSYVLGPAIVNIFTVILAIYSLVYVCSKRRIFNKVEVFLSLFIFYIILKEIFFSSPINYNFLGILRFYLIFLLIYKFKDQEINIFHIIFYSCLFISVDGIFQYFFYYDFFGYPKYESNRLTGVFGNEPIIGSFLIKFIFPILFYYLTIKTKRSFYAISILIIAFCIFLSGEKMAFIQLVFLSISMIIYLLIFKKNSLLSIKGNNLKFFGIFILIISSFLFFNQNYKNNRFYSLYNNISAYDYADISNPSNIHFNNSFGNYVYNFASALTIFQENRFFGNGYRDYNLNCKTKLQDSYLSAGCSTHPHNIAIEILTDHGILGLLLFYNFIFYLIFKNFSIKGRNYGFYISFIVLNFPFFTSQSIFSSYFGSIYFLILYLNYYIYLKNRK
tara:strand:+ start:261 stop:1529 length:1269 start_codon:yes stop_codon:yes gene_type:complete